MLRRRVIPGRLIALVAAAGALLACAPTADATLRPTRLESTCSSGYAYGEHTLGSWTVEGCSKQAIVLDGQEDRRYFRGFIEVNGMIFEISDSGPDLTATEQEDGDSTLFRSTSTTIVFDPLVNGTRKRFVMYTGTIDLEANPPSGGGGGPPPGQINSPSYGALQTASSARREAAARRRVLHDAAVVGIQTAYVDIPTSGSPKIFGLSLKNGIDGAAVRPQNSSIAATTEFNAELALATSGLTDLLRVQSDVDIELRDGTGLVLGDLELDFPTIELPGIGGLERFDIEYSSSSDSWTGNLDADLGSLIGEIEFEVEVSASTGSLLYIRTEASNLPPIPLGATGIVLDSVRFEFGFDPLLIAAGASATAGPTIAGTSLILLDGDIRMEFEPSFRLEVDGGARVLSSGNGELASGTFEFIYDADGLIFVGGDARFEATFLGVGIGADIGGSGAYSTTSKKFNIEAHATGELLLGFLGDFEVARFEAVVSGQGGGWGTCGRLLGFISGGIGQEWNGNMQVFTGCDLSDYTVRVTRLRKAQNGTLSRTFPVAEGTNQVAIELTADRPGPHVTLRAPDGSVRLVSAVGDRRAVDSDAVVLGKPDADKQLIALRNPPAGDWTVEWGAGDPQITGLRTATDLPALKATARVTRRRGDRPGRRRLTVKRTTKLGRGEKLMVAVRTRKGLVEVGQSDRSSFTVNFDENDTGNRNIVAIPVRNGIPIPTRKTVIGRYRATLPQRPASISKRRRGNRLTVLARVRRGAEAPDAWQYTFRSSGGRVAVQRGRVGKALTVFVPRRIGKVSVSARPVLRGRPLR